MELSKRREEIFLMEPELHAWASSYTDDPNLAYALVHHTLMKSWNALHRPAMAVTTRVWLAELMWHTVSTMDCFDALQLPAGMRLN
jgi:DNA-directed RNA polymerase specialized sigma24 family protein